MRVRGLGLVWTSALTRSDRDQGQTRSRTRHRNLTRLVSHVLLTSLIRYLYLYPSMRAGPSNPGPRSATSMAETKSGPAQTRGVGIVAPTFKPAKLRAVGTDFCGKLQPARNRFSFCGPPECNGGPAEGTSRRKIVRIYCKSDSPRAKVEKDASFVSFVQKFQLQSNCLPTFV